MKILHRIYFSPTGTTKQVLDSISEGLSFESVNEINLTTPVNATKKVKVENGIALIGVPVYGGRVPLLAIERLKGIVANNMPAVLVVVYGNRHYDDALFELNNLTLDIGFKPIAASTFIGEHSFSSIERPIAQSRPDEKDLMKGREFGKTIAGKINNVNSFDEIDRIVLQGNSIFKERSKMPLVAPVTDDNKCSKCGECVKVCPTGAITLEAEITTNIEDCILCAACVKACPTGGRVLENDFINGIRERLFANCGQRKEPVIYI